MPIYEYQCDACGHKLEVMQRMTEERLKTCPACTEETLTKIISRVGFQLKGTGWYETDFKHKGKPTDKAAAESKDDNPDKAAKREGDKSESAKSGDGAKDGGEADNKSTKSEAESST